MIKGADFSKCRNYRYCLYRFWDFSKPKVMCIGLNPSTANGETDDPTIRDLTRITQHLGYGGFYMMNLFAFVSSRAVRTQDNSGSGKGKRYLVTQDQPIMPGCYFLLGQLQASGVSDKEDHSNVSRCIVFR